MKRWICAFLCLLMILPMTAFAAEGDAVLAHGDGIYVSRIFAIGDTLYMEQYDKLMTFRAGDAQATEYSGEPDFSEYVGEDAGYSASKRFLERDGELWCLTQLMDYSEKARLVKTLLGRVAFGEDGTFTLSDVQELQWPAELTEQYDGNEYPMELKCAQIQGNMLYATSYQGVLYTLNLESGRLDTLNAGQVDLFAPYTNGALLLAGYDYQKDATQLQVYDPASGSVQPLAALKEQYPDGLAADPESGAVYALKDGMVCQVDLSTGERGEGLTDIPLVVQNQSNGWILGGQYYALLCDGGVVVRNLQPETRPERRLRISDGSWTDVLTDTYFEFSNAHSDVAVTIARDGVDSSKIIEDMMNRSSDTDIFILETSNSAYDALLERGFLAEMDSEALNGRMENVYPDVKERLTRNGHLVALPVNCYYYPLSFNARALERLGMSMDDVPTNWSDFLDFLAALPERMKEDSGVRLVFDGMTARDVRYQLFYNIFRDYQSYVNTEMDIPSYNTPILKELLEKLARVDFEAMGLPKGDEDAMGGMVVYEFGDTSTLMSIGSAASFGNFTGKDEQPVVMSLTAETGRIMSLQVSVAVINPFSENVALAQEFLECMAGQISPAVMYNLDPTLTEPILRENSEEYMQGAQAIYDEVKKNYEEADDADKQALEEELKRAEVYLENAEEDRWLVSQRQLDWVRNGADRVICEPVNWLYQDTSGLVEQYMSGQVSVDQLLKELDQKIRMMVMEGN